jgi:hypothetical protein
MHFLAQANAAGWGRTAAACHRIRGRKLMRWTTGKANTQITGWVNAGALRALARQAVKGVAWEGPGTRFAALSVGSRGFVNRQTLCAISSLREALFADMCWWRISL